MIIERLLQNLNQYNFQRNLQEPHLKRYTIHLSNYRNKMFQQLLNQSGKYTYFPLKLNTLDIDIYSLRHKRLYLYTYKLLITQFNLQLHYTNKHLILRQIHLDNYKYSNYLLNQFHMYKRYRLQKHQKYNTNKFLHSLSTL
ncbi:Hypothetical_protein [Hexamita inflata]|uniref:Hypothetical_protein n=1 Tax=Hexamita inflata TaxID=28002 RepID=A0AA86QFU3_9EUKA|nr:Hypothetical protein HINF_LOCUS43616 [Hexamita inflata]